MSVLRTHQSKPSHCRFRRIGFTFAEILVMIIMAGSCLPPMINMVDLGLQRTKSLEVKTAMENLAESKMNDLLYNTVFLGEMPTTGMSFVDYPNTVDKEYTLAVSVEVVAPVTIDDDISATGLAGTQERKLKGVSVEVGILASETAPAPDVASVSLFALFDKPRVPDDMIYAADTTNKRIYIIHPYTHQEIGYYSTAPHIPYYIAVHPSGEWLAIKTGSLANYILCMDIRPGSATKGQYAQVHLAPNLMQGGTAEPTNGTDGYRRSGGLVFRSDGKYLYYTTNPGAAYYLRQLSVPFPMPALHSIPIASWAMSLSVSLTADNVNDLELGQDGYLYAVRQDPTDLTKPIVRLNTHTNVALESLNPDFQSGTTSADRAKIRSIAQSWDGRELSLWRDDQHVGFLNPLFPTQLQDWNMSAFPNIGAAPSVQDLLVLPNNKWLVFTSYHGNNGSGRCRIGAVRRTDEGVWAGPGYDPTAATNQRAYNAGGDEYYQLRLSPNGNEFIADYLNSPSISFFNINSFLAGTAAPANFTPSGGSSSRISDVRARTREIAWIGVSSGTSHYMINFDIEGGGSRGRYLQETIVETASQPTFVALTAGGDIGAFGMLGATETQMLDVSGNVYSHPTTWPQFQNGTTIKQAVFSRDRSLVVGLERPTDSSIASYSHLATNGVRLYAADDNGNIGAVATLGVNLPGTDGWLVRDIVPMNTRNGAYVLMGVPDTTRAALIWLEKSCAGGLTGTEGTLEYKVMDCWVSTYDGFPEGRPYKMAISPDDSLIALYDPYGNGTNKQIRVYDMNNQHFPAQKGLVSLMYTGTSGNFTEAPASAPLNLKEALTKFLPTTGTVARSGYPGSIYNDSVSGAYGYNRSLRLCGYWRTANTQSFVGYAEGQFRAFVDGASLGASIYQSSGDSDSWTDDAILPAHVWNNNPTDGNHLFQIDCVARSGFAQSVGLGKITGAGGATGAPTCTNGLPPGFGGPTTGSYSALNDFETRAFRFRPILVSDILLDGNWQQAGDVPSAASKNEAQLTSDSDALDAMCFHRDLGFCYLFFFHDSSETVYGLDLFRLSSLHNFTPFNVGAPYTGSDADFDSMVVSPDGRRLLLTTNQDLGGYGIVLLDLDSTARTFSAPRRIDLPTGCKPFCMAVRPFCAFASQRDISFVSGASAGNYCGNQRATLATSGIYISGGSAGYDGTPTNVAQLFSPSTVSAVFLSSMATSASHLSLVSYDNDLFSLGGFDSAGNATSTVRKYSVGSGTWSNVCEAVQNNDNSPCSIAGQAAAQTPYGMVTIGGKCRSVSFHETVASSSMVSLASNLTRTPEDNSPAGTEAVFSGSDLLLGGGSSSAGSAFLTNPIPMTGSTNVFCYFKTLTNFHDGLCFVIQNLGSDAVGLNNAGLGYKNLNGITAPNANTSVALWLDNKSNDTAGGVDGEAAIVWDGYAPDQAEVADTPTVYASKFFNSSPLGNGGAFDQDGGAQTNHWWFVYDAESQSIDVWHGATSDPEGATHILKNVPYNLSNLGATAWFGFTGASNSATGYQKITDWTLKVWNTPVMTNHINKTDFSSTTGFTGYGEGTTDSNRLAITDAAAGNAGSWWYNTNITVSDYTSFRSKFTCAFDGASGGGEGLVSVLRKPTSSTLGSTGADDMGYDGITSSVGIEMDTRPDTNDPVSCDHFAALKGGAVADHHRTVAAPTELSTSGGATVFTVWVDYNGVSSNIRMYFATGSAVLKPTTPMINHIFSSKLTALLGGSLASFGFTARSRAGSPQANYVNSWQLDVGELAAATTLTNAVKVYYPHCFNPATGKWGETLDATPLPTGLCDGAAVNFYSRKDHKPYLFCVGGGTGSGNTVDSLLYKYDFDNPTTWTPIDPGDDAYTQRTGVAACVWGDEIFIFGGASGTVTNLGIAYNPDTGKYRSVTSLPAARAYVSAVPVGPYIFLIGGATTATGTSASGAIYRYKP